MLSNANDSKRDVDSIGVEGGRKKRGNAGSSGYSGQKKDNIGAAGSQKTFRKEHFILFTL